MHRLSSETHRCQKCLSSTSLLQAVSLSRSPSCYNHDVISIGARLSARLLPDEVAALVQVYVYSMVLKRIAMLRAILDCDAVLAVLTVNVCVHVCVRACVRACVRTRPVLV